MDDVAEWLRRKIANLVFFEREGSNPSVVDFILFVARTALPNNIAGDGSLKQWAKGLTLLDDPCKGILTTSK